jgi:hypothetical protein
MWEAVSRPLLPRLAKMFATKLKEEIEQCSRPEVGDTEGAARPSLTQKIRNLLSSHEKD